ncbi:MAG: T9SS type A sorting domain-containing protein, partial [Saprospiraceae bacterium]
HDIYQTHILTDNELDGFNELGSIWQSTDAGENWTLIQEFEQLSILQTAIDPTNPETMYFVAAHSQNGGIYKTTNLSAGANANWEKLAAPPATAGRGLSLEILNDGTLVATFGGGQTNGGLFTPTSGVFTSTDGGQNWEDRSADAMKYYTKHLTVDPHDASQNTWYAGVFDGYPEEHPSVGVGGLYRTQNRGESWVALGDFYRVESVTIHPENPAVMYVCTESEGLWYTDDLNAAQPTFRLLTSYLYHHPLRVIFNPFNAAEVWVSSFGNGLRRGDLSTSTAEIPIVEIVVNAYPNPSRSVIQFDLSIAEWKTQDLTFELFDSKGNLRITRSIDSEQFTITRADLNAGMYHFQISNTQQRLAMGRVVFQ